MGEHRKAQAYVNSPERRALEPERDKAMKFVCQFIIEEILKSYGRKLVTA
jgi:hypothetical protein